MAGDVISFKLDNGLTVLLKSDHRSHVTAVQMWVRVGGADESDSEAGISHVVEHMLFKGTEKRGVGKIAREVESVGGEINAYTSDDETVFHLVVPSKYTSLGLDIIADMVQHSKFDPKEFSKEKAVILEEIRRGKDEPRKQLYEDLMKLIYKKHPYGRPVIGYPETVEKLTRDQVYSHYKKWYVPNNMILVVVGDFDPQKVKNEIEELYKNFEPHPVKHPRPQEPYSDQLRVKVVKADVPKAYMAVGFLTTPLKNGSTVPLDIFSSFIAGENNRVLNRILKEQEKLVYFLSSYDYTPVDKGVFIITAYLEPSKITTTVSEISKVLREYRREEINGDMLELLKKETEREFIFSKETVQGQASDLGSFQLIGGDYGYEDSYLHQIKSVNPEKVLAAVKTFLKPSRARILVMIPKNSSISPEKLENSIKEAWNLKERKRIEYKVENLGEVKKVFLGDSAVLIFRHRDSIPTSAISIVMKGGLIADPPGRAGLNYILATMWRKRTQHLSPQELSDELDKIGGSISVTPNRDITTLTFTFLSEYRERAYSLFKEILLEPMFTKDDLEEARSDAIAILESLENNMWRYTLGEFLNLYYGNYPYGHLLQGKISDLRKVTLDDVKGMYKKLISQKPIIISAVGDIEFNSFLRNMKDLAFSLPHEELGISITEPHVVTGKEIFEKKEKNQTHILVGFPGVAINNSNRVPLEVIENILSGMGNRLFVDLRDKKSLAYVVTAANVSPMKKGFFIIYLATAPEKVNTAISSLKEEIKKIINKGFTEKELENAKEYMIGSLDVALQANSSISNTYAINQFYHDDPLFLEKKKKIIDGVTLKEINKLAKKFFVLDDADWVIIGEKK